MAMGRMPRSKCILPSPYLDCANLSLYRPDSAKPQEARREGAIQKPHALDPDTIASKPDLPARVTEKKAEPPIITNGHGLSHPLKSQITSSSSTNDHDRAKPQPEKEEGELADEPSIPASIANILKAPPGKEVVASQKDLPPYKGQREGEKEKEKVGNKRPLPLDDKGKTEEAKRQRVEGQNAAGATKLYTGTARLHQRNVSDGKAPASIPPNARHPLSKPTHPLSKPKENERPRGSEAARREERRDGAGMGAKTTGAAMPRLLSPLPEHLSSTIGTPMSRNVSKDSRRDRSPLRSTAMATSDSRDSRRGDVSPPRSQPMQKSHSRDLRRGGRSPARSQPMTKSDSRDLRRGDRSPARSQSTVKSDSRDSRKNRSPARSQPMAKSDSRDSRRGERSPRRVRSRSPPRSQPMQKGDSRDSRRAKSPAREHRRDRSPPRSIPMAKSTSKDSRGGRSPKNDTAPASVAKPRVRMPWEVAAAKTTVSSSTKTRTVFASSSSQKNETKKEEEVKEVKEVKKAPLPMPALMAFDLPANVEANMKRRLDNGEMKEEVAAAFGRIIGHKRDISNGSTLSSLSSLSNGSNRSKGRETREVTPVTDREKGEKKKTSTQALRERARKPDTPGVARKAVATKSKTKPQEKERLVVKMKYKRGTELAGTIEAILKGKPEAGHGVVDYQGRRGTEMIARRIDIVKREMKKENNKRPRSSPEKDEDEDEPPVKRSRTKEAGPSTPILSSSSQALIPPSISKLKNENGSTPETPGDRNTNTSTPQMEALSPTATRSAPSTSSILTDRQREDVKAVRAESELYISLGTTLKRQRDVIIRPSPDSPGVSETGMKKANIMGVESLLAYLVGFEAMDRAYKLEGSRNKGAHWKSLFPYLDSYRAALKSSTTDDRVKVVLDIVASLVGYSGASCLATLHNNLLEKEGAPNSRDEMLNFIKEQTANFKRREAMAECYRKRCLEVNERWPDMIGDGMKLAWIKTPGGQFVGVEEVKGILAGIVKGLCQDSNIEWESKLDF